MEDSVKGIKSQILYDWRNHFETRAQFELFIMQIDMLIESVEKECKLTKRAPDICPECDGTGDNPAGDSVSTDCPACGGTGKFR